MTPAEEIFDRIAAAMERQAEAQERSATALEEFVRLVDLVTDPPEEEEAEEPVCVNLRMVENET